VLLLSRPLASGSFFRLRLAVARDGKSLLVAGLVAVDALLLGLLFFGIARLLLGDFPLPYPRFVMAAIRVPLRPLAGAFSGVVRPVFAHGQK
jgi:hypothetical protein